MLNCGMDKQTAYECFGGPRDGEILALPADHASTVKFATPEQLDAGRYFFQKIVRDGVVMRILVWQAPHDSSPSPSA